MKKDASNEVLIVLEKRSEIEDYLFAPLMWNGQAIGMIMSVQENNCAIEAKAMFWYKRDDIALDSLQIYLCSSGQVVPLNFYEQTINQWSLWEEIERFNQSNLMDYALDQKNFILAFELQKIMRK